MGRGLLGGKPIKGNFGAGRSFDLYGAYQGALRRKAGAGTASLLREGAQGNCTMGQSFPVEGETGVARGMQVE